CRCPRAWTRSQRSRPPGSNATRCARRSRPRWSRTRRAGRTSTGCSTSPSRSAARRSHLLAARATGEGTVGRGAPAGGPPGAGGGRRPDEQPDARAAGPTSASRDDARGTGARARDTGERPHRGRTARHRDLLDRPLELFTARDVAEARELVRELGARLRGRLARRERALRRGRLDLRRTLRVAVTSGGVPVRLRRRGRRPGRPDLIALCDLSGSVAAPSELLLGLMPPP